MLTDNPAPIAIIICTLNEESNIDNCLRTVTWADQRFVVDAFSTDNTPSIAQSLGAEVVQHKWQGYAEQKNWALDNLPIQHEWVLL